MKRLSKLLLILTAPFMLVSCSTGGTPQEQEESYETWRMSDKAYDYNNDRKITEEDFLIYKEFTAWYKSENAVDLNGDHVITYEDYLLYKQGSQSFETWKNSTDACDYDGDGQIASSDYTYFLLFKNDIGKYTVANVSVNGTVNNLSLLKTRIPFDTFLSILCRSDLEIKKDNSLKISIKSDDAAYLGEDYQEAKTLLDQTRFTKKTENLAEISAIAEVKGIKLEIAFYLERDTAYVGGVRYNSSFNFSLDFGTENPITAIGSFSVVKTNE